MREEVGRGLQSSRLAIIGWRTVYSNKGSKLLGLGSFSRVSPLLFPYQLNLVKAAMMRKWRCKGCGIAKHIKAIVRFYLCEVSLGIFIESITFWLFWTLDSVWYCTTMETIVSLFYLTEWIPWIQSVHIIWVILHFVLDVIQALRKRERNG